VGDAILLSIAKQIMAEHGIRHLPVLHQAKIVGIISDRDINLALSIHPNAKDLLVKDVMTEEPYCVTEDCELTQVATEMANHRYGCAVIENEQGRAIGIFTTVDALRILGETVGSKKRAEIRLIR
jgi:acetoin utilization protein AcuB